MGWRRKTRLTDAAERELGEIQAAIRDRDAEARTRELILDLAQSQADVMIAIAAARIDDDGLVKESLSRATSTLQGVIRELQAAHTASKARLEEDTAKLGAIRRSLDRG